jgi:hypothetical protein
MNPARKAWAGNPRRPFGPCHGLMSAPQIDSPAGGIHTMTALGVDAAEVRTRRSTVPRTHW